VAADPVAAQPAARPAGRGDLAIERRRDGRLVVDGWELEPPSSRRAAGDALAADALRRFRNGEARDMGDALRLAMQADPYSTSIYTGKESTR
jgi:hypothetical protein